MAVSDEIRERSDIMRSNERVKFLSTVGSNLGTALFAAGAGRWFFVGFDEFVFLWLLASIMLLWTAWYILMMIESEA